MGCGCSAPELEDTESQAINMKVNRDGLMQDEIVEIRRAGDGEGRATFWLSHVFSSFERAWGRG